jgi:hypothetical protein
MGGWLDSYHSAGQPQPPIICLNGFDAPDQKKHRLWQLRKRQKSPLYLPWWLSFYSIY